MADRISYGVAETGTWQTASPTPHIDLDGGVPSGISIRQSFAAALTSGESVTVTVRKDIGNWACYGYESGNAGTTGPEFTDASPDTLDFSAANLLESNGTLANGDAVDVWVELPEPDAGSDRVLDGYTETGDTALTSSAGTLTVPLDGRPRVMTLTENVTLAVTAPSAPECGNCKITLIQAVEGYTVTVPAGWETDGSNLAMSTGTGSRKVYLLDSDPDGTINILSQGRFTTT